LASQKAKATPLDEERGNGGWRREKVEKNTAEGKYIDWRSVALLDNAIRNLFKQVPLLLLLCFILFSFIGQIIMLRELTKNEQHGLFVIVYLSCCGSNLQASQSAGQFC